MGSVLSSQRRRRVVGLALMLAFLVELRRRKKQRAKSRVGGGVKPAKKKPGTSEIWEILWPSFSGPKKRPGEARERLLLAAMMSLFALRIPITYFQTINVREIDRALFTRDAKARAPLVWRAFLLMVLTTVHRQSYLYCRRSLAVLWRRKLTVRVLSSYFAGQNFYELEGKYDDADARIVDDVQKLADGFAQFTGDVGFVASTGLFFSAVLARDYGVLFTSSPFVYIALATVATSKLAPFDFKQFGEIETLKAAYRSAHSRLAMHAEAVFSLRGGDAEREVANERFSKLMERTAQVQDGLSRFVGAMSLAFKHGLGAVMGWFVIGPGLFGPSPAEALAAAGIAATPAALVAHLAEMRASVGYQFMLVLQLVFSAFTTRAAVTEYSKLRGNAARVAGLLATVEELERDKAARAQEQAAMLASGGDRIQFDDVTVCTPAGVELVHSLSFTVEHEARSDSLLLTGHNGAGKSSIFRCLAGLWPVAAGSIRRPAVASYQAAWIYTR